MSLSSDEDVIYLTRFSTRTFLKPLAVSVVALVLAFAFRRIAGEYATYVFWTFIVVAVLSLVPAFTKYFLSQFLVTNQRVVIRHGLLARTSYEMILTKIESIAVNQSLSDRSIWGSGTLVITGTGGTKEISKRGRCGRFQEHWNQCCSPSTKPGRRCSV